MTNVFDLLNKFNGAERLTIEAISRDTNVPIVEVANLYRLEKFYLESIAPVKSFVPLNTSCQVRTELRQIYH